ncbi:unnamed protein product, partial [Vitis vinifera]|uniref:Uncharacterized protein n=1 Tax=Vitis vinifera TaxID=29760 RepID=D7T7Y7_VITVI
MKGRFVNSQTQITLSSSNVIFVFCDYWNDFYVFFFFLVFFVCVCVCVCFFFFLRKKKEEQDKRT